MSKIFDPATDFNFTPASFVPFKDRELCEKLSSEFAEVGVGGDRA